MALQPPTAPTVSAVPVAPGSQRLPLTPPSFCQASNHDSRYAHAHRRSVRYLTAVTRAEDTSHSGVVSPSPRRKSATTSRLRNNRRPQRARVGIHPRRQILRQSIAAQVGRDQRHVHLALEHLLVLKDLEHDLGHFLVLRDRLQRIAHDARAHRRRFRELPPPPAVPPYLRSGSPG